MHPTKEERERLSREGEVVVYLTLDLKETNCRTD